MTNRILFARLFAAVLTACLASGASLWAQQKPNVVLVMADDQGWGQVGYYNHPVLKTPNLDAMAANGLRFDRFYAGAPVCSPTRASVLTGRSNDRTGVYEHGNALRLQEKTLPRAMLDIGYATGHFGKWHLNGLRGPGVPILGDDKYHPGLFGYETWVAVTNFFDRNPIMSRNGSFEEFEGDSSEVVVAEALKFMERHSKDQKPFFTTIWYGSPHAPFGANNADKKEFAALKPSDQDHYGELVAMDRSIGTLRQGLRKLGIEKNTILWFCSDNGGLPKIEPDTVGGLRGNKGTLYEGGLRVPAIIEWPREITQNRITRVPACTMDIFPTIASIVGIDRSAMLKPLDGMSLKAVIRGSEERRNKPIPFRSVGRGALIDNQFKLVTQKVGSGEYELYNLSQDPKESKNLFELRPEVATRMKEVFERWSKSVDASDKGLDYPEQRLTDPDPRRISWSDLPEYEPYFEAWKKRPEYSGQLKGK